MGKIKGNSGKGNPAANTRNAQSGGKGIAQGFGAGNRVTSAKPKKATGLKQAGTGANTPPAAKRGINKLNKAPISAQPKKPKTKKNNLVLRNSVTKADVARLRKAHQLDSPSAVGGSFKGFIGGK